MLEPPGNQPIRLNRGHKLGIIGTVLMMLIPLIIILVVYFTQTSFTVSDAAKSVEEYNCAMTEIRKNKKAIELLGEPMTDDSRVSPNIRISGAKRDVQFRVSMSGPKGTADLIVISFRDSFRSDFKMLLGKDDKGETLYKGTYPCQ